MLINFDFDGVLVDSFDQLLRLTVHAQQAMRSGRRPVAHDLRTVENLTFEGVGRQIGVSEDELTTFGSLLFELQQEKWGVEVFPGITEVLEELAIKNTLVVITASEGQAVEETLLEAGLGGVIFRVLGGELAQTKAERITSVRTALSFSPEDTLMIGDAISDIREGKRAGVRTVGVSWGFQDRALLERESPDYLVDHPRDLCAIPGHPPPGTY